MPCTPSCAFALQPGSGAGLHPRRAVSLKLFSPVGSGEHRRGREQAQLAPGYQFERTASRRPAWGGPGNGGQAEGIQQAGPVLHLKEAEGVFCSTDTPRTSHLLLALRELRAARHPKRSEGSRALEGRWPARRTPPPSLGRCGFFIKALAGFGWTLVYLPPVLSASAPFRWRTLPSVCPEKCGEGGGDLSSLDRRGRVPLSPWLALSVLLSPCLPPDMSQLASY